MFSTLIDYSSQPEKILLVFQNIYQTSLAYNDVETVCALRKPFFNQ